MSNAQAEAGAEQKARVPQESFATPVKDVATGNDSTVGGDSTSGNPHALLVDQVLSTYQDSKTTGALATPGEAGGTASGEDGFAIVADGDATLVAHGLDDAKKVMGTDSPKDASESKPRRDAIPIGDGLFIVDMGFDKTLVANFDKANIRPANYVAKGGETLQQLAAKHLGPKATEAEIKRYMSEISLINEHVGEKGTDYVAQKGDRIRFPGHTMDGAVVVKDSRGTQYATTIDGKVKVTYLDGTGFERTPTDKGMTKKYFGPKPEDNYTVELTRDGKVVSNDRVDPNHRKAEDVAAETKRLEDIAGKTFGIKAEREQFMKDMQQFVERARKDGLGDKEVAQTFAEVSRLLEAKGTNQPMTGRERVRLVSGIMRGAAYPTSNSQGDHSSCSMSALETRLYIQQPSVAARALADIATTSKLVAADGTVVRMDPNDLRAHGEGAENAARGLNTRSYASQIFQVAAANTFHTSRNERTVPPGEVRYSQVKRTGSDDTGERLIDFGKRTPEVEKGGAPGAAATHSGVRETSYLLTGSEDRVLYSKHLSPSLDDTKDTLNTVQDLIAKLEEAKASGKPMAIGLMLHANNPPFYKQQGENPLEKTKPDLQSFLADLHFVNIVGYDESTQTVQVDNQWGDEKDMITKPISVYELFNATQRTTGNTWLGRLDERWHDQSNERNAEQLKHIMTSQYYHWADEREPLGLEINDREMANTMDNYNRLVERLPLSYRESVRKHVSDLNVAWERGREERSKFRNPL